jgi:hypothetical protein
VRNTALSANFGIRISKNRVVLVFTNVRRRFGTSEGWWRGHAQNLLQNLDKFILFSQKVLQRVTMNVEVLWSSLWPNKVLVLTLHALCNFYIIARHKGLVVVSAVFCRSGRWRVSTTQALGLLCISKNATLFWRTFWHDKNV